MLDAVLFRTSGILTSALSPCHQSYLALLRQALGDLAQLHVLTDLSLSLAPDLAAAELRRLSDTHEQKLSQQLNGVPTFAYTVADIVAAFPSVAWPIPGELHPTAMLNNDTRLWLSASWERLEARGMRLTRRLETGRVVSNLLSYYVHEPSLCVWLRRRQLASGDDVARRVWVLEEDVLFLGDVRRALLPFANSSADLIAVFQPSAYIDAEWWLHVNPAFRAALPGRPLHKWEHVERYSVALLLKLEDLLQRGAAAYGELFGSTVCSRMSWCATADPNPSPRPSPRPDPDPRCATADPNPNPRPTPRPDPNPRCATADLREAGLVPRDAKMFADTVISNSSLVIDSCRQDVRRRCRWPWDPTPTPT